MANIKETLELVDLLKKLGDAALAAKADGKIDWRDAGKFGPVIVQARAALTDGKLIPAELADLDASEVEVLVTKLTEAVQSLVNAVVA